MDNPDESARAPMRAHILASINPFESDLASRSHGRARDVAGSGKRSERRQRKNRSERSGNDTEFTADGHTQPDPRPMRWKTKPTENGHSKHSLDDHGGRHGMRSQSRDHGTDSDSGLGKNPVTSHDTRNRENSQSAAKEAEANDTAPRKDTADKGDHTKEEEGRNEGSQRRHHRKHRHHHRRQHRRDERDRSRTRSKSPALDDSRRANKRRRRHRSDEAEEEDPYADPPLDPDAAFRQSLFDAMADDEGAAYWEAVYGQPVHEYAEEAKTRQQQAVNDPDGVSAMNDEEYADYVRQRMWERSQEGRREARENQKRQRAAATAAEKERVRAKMRAFEQDRRHWAAVERSLRRGETRRQQKRWRDRWQTYATAWTSWEASPLPATIPWPVERAVGDDKDGKPKEDDFVKEVRAFFTGGPQDDSDSGDNAAKPATEASLLARLRDERVRWHPDKMQQRLGGSVDAGVMRDITAIFQVVDRLWGELRGKTS
ncbi:hypothetical protein SEPCBS57363_000041 [Sporothrix epigloea]|uniref:Uncharacterized protein n=1 Tax=Sporothrix epigloea TaxID=1892477 RepID=A0ABP0D3L0_9PEZI